jgi:6-phosphogluconate dehydrogenase
MIIGLVGLGRMGQAIAARLLASGIDVIGYDRYLKQAPDLSIHEQKDFQAQCAFCADFTHGGQPRCAQPENSADARAQERGTFRLESNLGAVAREARIIWLMVPAGNIVDEVIAQLMPHLQEEDIVIDGGNSFFQDSIRRFNLLKEHAIQFIDCGTSGGLHGRCLGFSLMIGGDPKAYNRCEQAFRAVAAPNGYAHVGPAGAGHYVKMVHNGIEYGLLQAYAEGFQILKEGHYKELDLARISALWNHGSIIRSWILQLACEVFTQDQELKDIYGAVAEGGTGLWTVQEANRHGIPAELIKQALTIRAQSRQTGGNYATKVVALLRHAFGGHPVGHAKKET